MSVLIISKNQLWPPIRTRTNELKVPLGEVPIVIDETRGKPEEWPGQKEFDARLHESIQKMAEVVVNKLNEMRDSYVEVIRMKVEETKQIDNFGILAGEVCDTNVERCEEKNEIFDEHSEMADEESEIFENGYEAETSENEQHLMSDITKTTTGRYAVMPEKTLFEERKQMDNFGILAGEVCDINVERRVEIDEIGEEHSEMAAREGEIFGNGNEGETSENEEHLMSEITETTTRRYAVLPVKTSFLIKERDYSFCGKKKKYTKKITSKGELGSYQSRRICRSNKHMQNISSELLNLPNQSRDRMPNNLRQDPNIILQKLGKGNGSIT